MGKHLHDDPLCFHEKCRRVFNVQTGEIFHALTDGQVFRKLFVGDLIGNAVDLVKLDVREIFLQLYTGKVLWKENHTLARFLEAYRRQFAGGNTYVPQTSYQAASILQFLGGQYGG